jgi:hypothetical protein
MNGIVKNIFMENGIYKEKEVEQENISWKMKDGKRDLNNCIQP